MQAVSFFPRISQGYWCGSLQYQFSSIYLKFSVQTESQHCKIVYGVFISLIDVSLSCIFWLEYCRYGVNAINQSINQSIKGRLTTIPVWFSFSQYLASYLRSDFTLHIILHSFTNAITLLTMNIVNFILFLFSAKLDTSDYFINCSFL